MTRRPGTIEWTAEMRKILHLLHAFHTFNLEARVSIFNNIFRERLAECGLPEGAKEGQLTSQYGERNKKRVRQKWDEITRPPTTAGGKKQEELLMQRIEAARLEVQRKQITMDQQSKRFPLQLPQTPERPSPRKRRRIVDDDESGDCGELMADQPSTPLLQTEYVRRDHGLSSPDGRKPKRRWADIDVATSGCSHLVREWVESTPQVMDGHSNCDLPPSSRRIVKAPQQQTRNKAVVVIQKLSSPKTVLREARLPASRRPGATELLTHQTGYSIYLTPHELAASKVDIRSVSEELAHPHYAGLLFRYWDNSSAGYNNKNGFVCGRYQESNLEYPGPPSLEAFPWPDLALHVNRKKVASPFISTSNNLFWILRVALKELKRGDHWRRITLINQSELEPRSIFHAKAMTDAIKHKRALDNGCFRYSGLTEFLVWSVIPTHAVVNTFNVTDLLALISSNASLAEALHLADLVQEQDYTKLRRTLQSYKTHLTPDIVRGFSQICKLFGLNQKSPIEHIAHIISDLIQGWSFHISFAAPEEWLDLANTFAYGLCSEVTLRDLQKLKLSFLDGVKWGLGERNARQRPHLALAIQRKATRVGVKDPERMLAEELDGIKLHIVSRGMRQQRLKSGRGQEMAQFLDDGEDGEEFLDEEIQYEDFDE